MSQKFEKMKISKMCKLISEFALVLIEYIIYIYKFLCMERLLKRYFIITDSHFA